MKYLVSIILYLVFASSLHARDLFELSLDIETPVPESAFTSFDNLDDLLDTLDTVELQKVAPNYREFSTGDLTLDIRGLPAIASFEDETSRLRFQIPVLGFDREFIGATRDDSWDEFENFLEANGEDLLTQILQKLVETTPIDPVAGNPNSLTARMGAASFDIGTDVGGSGSFEAGGEPAANSFELGVRFGRFAAGEFTQNSYTLPLKYTFRFSDPRYQLILDLPTTYTDTEGGQTIDTSLGVGFRFPVLDDWTLTPAVRVGAVGSVDLAAAAIVTSGSLTSNYNFRLADFKFSLGNHVSYFRTGSISVDDYEFSYDLQNIMIKNGIGVEGDTGYRIWNIPVTWHADIAHTQFFGDDLFIDSYIDLSASIGLDALEGWNDFQLGVTFQKALGEDYHSFSLTMGYKF